jgi:hypothetical protein
MPAGPSGRRSRSSLRSARTWAEVISGESQMPPNRGKAAIRRVPTVQISLPPLTSLYIFPTLWRRRKLRTKCGILSARSAPERSGPRRFCPSRRAFSPCEIKTVRFSAGMRSGQHSLNYRLSATVLWYSCEPGIRGAKSDSMARMIYERFLAEPCLSKNPKPLAQNYDPSTLLLVAWSYTQKHSPALVR